MPVVSNAIDKRSVLPDGYTVDFFKIINFSGEEKDIFGIITDFSIAESIYSFGLKLSFNVIDGVNFFEDFSFSGMEQFKLKIRKRGLDNEEVSTELQFRLEEMPVFSKTANNSTGIYTFKCISTFMFDAEFIRLSRVYNGTTTEIIKKILIEDLGIPEEKIEIRSESNSGIITYIPPAIKPIRAITDLLNSSQDDFGSPMYLWHSINDNIIIDSLDGIKNRSNGFEYRRNAPGIVQPIKDLDRNRYSVVRFNIIDFISDIKLSRYKMGSNGAYASERNVVNLKNKSYNMNERVIHDNSKDLGLNETHGSRLETIITTDDVTLTASEALNRNIRESKRVKMMTMKHDLTLHGDLRLLVGESTSIVIPKNIEGGSSQDLVDKSLSGEYVITSVVHVFKEKHRMSVRLQRDEVLN